MFALVHTRAVAYLSAMTQDDTSTMSAHQPDQDGAAAAATSGDTESSGSPETLMQAASARIQELEASFDEMRDRWMRAEAEIQNVRSRAKREAEDARLYAVQKFARDVVEAAENLRRGITSLPAATPDDSPVLTKLREGFESVERSFLGVLERNGIVGNDPTGSGFDANLHQAMAEQPSADHPPGTVIQSWTPAWTLNGRLLKPAMVVVSKAAPTSPTGAGPETFDKTI